MDTREYDLESLAESRRKAKTGRQRDFFEKAMDKILRENGAVRERREKLIMAVRTDDKRAIRRFQHELMTMRANETYGRDY